MSETPNNRKRKSPESGVYSKYSGKLHYKLITDVEGTWTITEKKFGQLFVKKGQNIMLNPYEQIELVDYLSEMPLGRRIQKKTLEYHKLCKEIRYKKSLLEWFPLPETTEYLQAIGRYTLEEVKSYTHQLDKFINGHLKAVNLEQMIQFKYVFPEQTKSIRPIIQTKAELIQKTIFGFPLPRKVVVWRGLKLSNESIEDFEIGYHITSDQFISTSLDLETAVKFKGDFTCCLYKITIEKGQYGLPLLGAVFMDNEYVRTSFYDEREVLLPWGTVMEITSIRQETLEDVDTFVVEFKIVKQPMIQPARLPRKSKSTPIIETDVKNYPSINIDQQQLHLEKEIISLTEASTEQSTIISGLEKRNSNELLKWAKESLSLKDEDVSVHGGKLIISS